jgi:hypothetical protein
MTRKRLRSDACSMRRPALARMISWTVIVSGLLGGGFLAGLYSGVTRNVAYALIRDLYEATRIAVRTVVQETPVFMRVSPKWHLQPARHAGSGVTINDTRDDDLVLLSGFFEDGNELRLIRRDGSIVARWPVAFSKIFTDTRHILEPPSTDWNTDTHGALVLPDGSVVFVFEYHGLVKLDRCGKLEWKVAEATHHSVERAEAGGYWVPGRKYVLDERAMRFPPFKAPYSEDTILRISENGAVLEEMSVVELIYRSDMEAWLTAGHGSDFEQQLDGEILHLNKVSELKSKLAAHFPQFAAGDLLLSIRELNMVLVTDPHLRRIKWWRVGPWIRQHDPEFTADGRVSVFNSNAYETAFGPDNPFSQSYPTIPRSSNIIELDPTTDEYRIAYGGVKAQEMLSVIRGKHELTERGGLLITEFEGGRVFETDSDGRTIWQYVNRHDAEQVAEITEARIYQSDYFSVSDWSCGTR